MNPNEPKRLREAQIHRALGVFLLFFALTVLVSVFFTSTPIGKWTDLGAGTIFGAIGVAMILKGRRVR